jgi:hypothetical protein
MMNITTRQFLKSAGVAAAALLACGVGIASAQVIIVERGPMPALREEVIPVAPSPRHHWVRGHWVWRGRWEWVPGHYFEGVVPAVPVEVVEVETVRPGAEYFWVKGHHVWEGGHWVWHKGVWAR